LFGGIFIAGIFRGAVEARVHGRAGHKRLDSGGAREREEKEVVVLAITRVELI
jgi:hypothetical protein